MDRLRAVLRLALSEGATVTAGAASSRGAPALSPPANPSPARFLKLLGVAANAGDAEDIEVDWRKPLIGAQRQSVWHMLRGETIDAACRKVAAKGML